MKDFWRKYVLPRLGRKPKPTIVFGDGSETLALEKCEDGSQEKLTPIQLAVLNDGSVPCGKTDIEIHITDDSHVYLNGKQAPSTLTYHLDNLAAHKHVNNLIDGLQVDTSQESKIILEWEITEASSKDPCTGKLTVLVNG